MPEPLVCEDSDLQRLLDTVHSQPGAEILYQDQVRRGGLFGFFAREVHRVAYRVVTEEERAAMDAGDNADSVVAEEERAPMAADGDAEDLPELSELLASVDAAESAGHQPVEQQPSRPDFAELLRTLADADHDDADLAGSTVTAELVATGSVPGEPLTAELAYAAAVDLQPVGFQAVAYTAASEPVLARPVNEPAPMGTVTAFGKPDARARLELLMQLRQVGVPVSVNPRADTHTLYEALESILEELPVPAVPPGGAGEILVIIGESGQALQAARTCASMLRIPRSGIRIAGLPEHSGPGSDHPVISSRQEALRLRGELSRADHPSIVVIATDATEAGSDDPWAAEMLAALRPTAAWAVIDARWKTEDSRAQLNRLGRIDALVVHSAQLSASPASVWDLDLPLGLLDGRTATTFVWTGLLVTLLGGAARHRASA
jgi:hypothetical protein